MSMSFSVLHNWNHTVYSPLRLGSFFILILMHLRSLHYFSELGSLFLEQFVHLSIEEQLSCFQFLAVMNKAATNFYAVMFPNPLGK